MIRFGLSIMLMLFGLPAGAAEPDDYAWSWPLQTDRDAAAYRFLLEPEIVRSLIDDQARDLAIFDADGRAMPLLRVPPERLVETVTTTRELDFEARAHSDRSQPAGADAAGTDSTLSLLLLRPDGTRLELRAPETDPAGRDAAIVYEALIEGPPRAGVTQDAGAEDHWLITQWTAAQPPEDALNCTLKSVDRPGIQGTALAFQTAFDTRPASMIARTRVSPVTRGWHLSCRAGALPPDLTLTLVRIESRHRFDHARRAEIPLPMDNPELGVLQGRIEHPFVPQRLRVSAAARNQLSRVRLLLRRGPDEPWRRHGETELSTLHLAPDPRRRGGMDENQTAGRVVFDLGRQPLRRLEWRLESTPPLAQPVEVALEARLEEWLFLAQGQAPWRLHAGSLQALPSNPDLLSESTLGRLGPAWELRLAEPRQRSEAGGSGALQPPPQPLPWTRWLLWLVLIGGSLTVSWLALRLLRNRD